jgi:hypothetical protein
MRSFLGGCAVIALFVFGLVKFGDWIDSTEWGKRNAAESAAREKAARTPRVIRTADGCQVYAWQDSYGGTTHYFTRCPNARVTTERNFTANCGKNCTKHMTEATVTESQ